ncbi:MAG: GAF domain-containing protein, partial [Chloroflexi bacterium]|nr:GAF domain-containing protein [Chloroflexota bacterium]
EDLMLVPLYGARGRWLGLMSVDDPRSGRRPSRDVVEALELFGSLAAFSIENFRLIQRIQQEAEATRRERDRLAQLHLVASEIQSAPDVPSRLQVVANGIHDAGWDHIVITLRDEHLEPTALIQAGYTPEEAMLLSDDVLPGSVWRAWINDLEFYELNLGAGYYMRYNHPWVQQNVFGDESPDPESVPDDVWHPQDVLYLPLVGQDQKRIIGMIAMQDPVDGLVPTEASLQPFELIASQAAAAIETTRLYLETVRAAEQEQRLNEMMEVVTGSISPEGVLQAIGRGLQQMVPFTRMSVAIFNEATGHFDVLRADIELDSSVNVQPDEPLSIEDTAMGFAYTGMKSHIYQLQNEQAARETYVDLAAWYANGERSVMIVPMVAGGQATGTLRLSSELENAFGFKENLDLIQRLANLSAVALDNARLFQEVREREHFLAAMQRVTQSLNQIFDLGSVLRTICDESLPILGVEGAYVWLTVGEELIGIAASGSAHEAFSGMTVPIDDEHILASRVASERSPLYVNNLQQREDRAQIVPLTQLQTIHAILGVPLLREDRVLGTLMLVEADAGQRFDDTDVEQASVFGIQAAIAIENARLFEEAEQRASELDAQAQRLALINRIATRVAQAFEPREIYEIALNELQDAVGAMYSGLVLFESETTGRLVMGTHPNDAARADTAIVLVDNVSVDLVRETHRPVTSEDVQHDPRFKPVWKSLEARGTQAIMIVPLIVGDEVIGTIGLDFAEHQTFTANQIELAETIASQVSVALDKANLLKEAEQRAAELDRQARRLATLNRMSARLSQTLDPPEIYSILLNELQAALGVQSSNLMLIQGNESHLALSTHPMDSPLPDLRVPIKGNHVVESIVESKHPYVAEDVLEDPQFEMLRDFHQARGIGAILMVPVTVGDRVYGMLGLNSAIPRKFTEAEIELAVTAANQGAVALEKARLFTETQQRAIELDAQAQRLALINRVSTRLAQTLDPQEIYAIVLSELADVLEIDLGGLVLFEDDTLGRLVLSYPFDQPTPDYIFELEGNRSMEVVRRTRQPLVSEDPLSDPAFEKAWDILRERGTRSLIVVPLVVGDQVIGTVGLDSTHPREFTEAEIELAQTIVSQAALAVEKGRLYNETLNLTIFNQAVVESIQQGIVVLDRELNVRRVNRYMTEFYGWGADAVGHPLFGYRPDYEDFLREPIAVALGMGEPQAEFEVERTDSTGGASIRNYYVYPMLEGRTVTGIVILVEDVTERARLEADLNARAIQMAALSEVSGQITSTLEPDQVINLILDALGRVIPFDGVSLWQLTPEQDELSIIAARGYDAPGTPDANALIGQVVQLSQSALFREMAEQAQVVNVGDVSVGDTRFPHGDEAAYKSWLGTPLISKGTVVGVLTLEKEEPNFYNALHEQLTLTFANQAAVALENARLFQETRDRAIALDEQAQRLALLNRVSLALAQTLDLENILEIALRETSISLGVNEGAAIQMDQENQLAQIIVEYPRGDAPPEQVFDLGKNAALRRVQESLLPLAVEDIDASPMAASLRQLLRRDDVMSTLLVPLLVGGNVIGLLRLDAVGHTRPFTHEQVELAQTIASQAAIAVQNAALFEQSAVRTSELETLFESAQATAVTLDLNEVVRRVTIQMLSALRADACTIFLWDDVNNRLIVHGDISARPDDVVSDQPGDIHNVSDYPLRGRALRERELIIMRADEPDWPEEELQVLIQHRAASRMLIPLVVNELSIGLVEVETVD